MEHIPPKEDMIDCFGHKAFLDELRNCDWCDTLSHDTHAIEGENVCEDCLDSKNIQI